MPSPVTLYILHHPQSTQACGISQHLLKWFRLSDSTGNQSDAGLPVWYRRGIAPVDRRGAKKASGNGTAGGSRFRIDPKIAWQDAHLNVVIILVDEYLVSSLEWCSAIEDLSHDYKKNRKRMLLLPVALHDSFYRMTDLYQECNPLRLLDAPSPEAAAVTLRRQISEAITRRLRLKSRARELSKLNVFLSHAKADGREIAERIRDSLSRYGQMDAWYDANELAIGDAWRKKILTAAGRDTAAMIAIVTDNYSSRPWCRMEVEVARTPQPVDSGTWRIWKLQPAVAVHLPGNTWSRTMQALAGLPRLGWNREQPEVSIAEVVDRLMLETLLAYAHRQVARELRQHARPTGILRKRNAICVTWTPCPYTLAALRDRLATENSPLKPAKILYIVYPGYDLRPAEAEELSTVLKSFNEQTKLVSFEEAFLLTGNERRKLQLPTESRSHRTKVAVSGVGNDSELQPHGMGCEHLDELLSRLTIALLTANCQLILGGSLAKLSRAATTRLLDIAQTWLPPETLKRISLGTPRTWPFQNFLQWPDCEQLTPEHHASLAGVCHLHAVVPPGLPPAPMAEYLDAATRRRYAADSTRILRKSTTELADLRIVFGGLLKATPGWMPSALEEAGLSIQKKQPLIILGGFGGAAAEIARFLVSRSAPVPESLQYSEDWVLRKSANLPPETLRGIADFHNSMLEALHSWRSLLHQRSRKSELIHRIPRGILLDCLSEHKTRRAVRLAIDALHWLNRSHHDT
jgi:hypothetical protein